MARPAEKPLPPLHLSGGTSTPPRARAPHVPKPSPALVAARTWRWLVAALHYQLGLSWLRLRGQDSPAARADLAQRVVVAMGDSASRVMRQLAIRLDVLSIEVSSTLTHLPDSGPPLPIDVVVAIVERSLGAPLHTRFAVFDPTPISAETLSVVHQAELLDGRRVAVRVQRPGAAERLAADVTALGLLLTLVGPLAGRRARVFDHLRGELKAMLLQDLDFLQVARRSRLFRRRAREGGLKWVSTARMHKEMCRNDVVVSEFVAGVRLDEVFEAVRRGDAESRRWLAERGIDPRRLSRRLLALGFWQIFENSFFDEAPEPYQVLVEPGNRLRLLHLTDCGRISRTKRRQLRDALEALSQHDIEGGFQAMLGLLAPLPPIDVHELSHYAESRLWSGLFAIENKESPWAERTSAPLWLAVVKACNHFDVPMTMDLLRMMRAMTIWDSLAVTLWPGTRFLHAFRRYRRDAARRSAKSAKRRLKKGMTRSARNMIYARAPELMRSLGKASSLLQVAADDVPLTTTILASKASYAASVLLTGATRAIYITIAGAIAIATAALSRGEALDWGGAVDTLTNNPLYLMAQLLVVVLAIREIAFRLDDLDPKRKT